MSAGGDPRFGGGATPPPVKQRGSRLWIAFWGLFTLAVGAGYAVLDLMDHYAPDPVPWREVGLGSPTPLSVAIMGAGVGLVVAGLLLAITRRG